MAFKSCPEEAELVRLEQILPQLDSEDFGTPSDSEDPIQDDVNPRSPVKRTSYVGPKTGL